MYIFYRKELFELSKKKEELLQIIDDLKERKRGYIKLLNETYVVIEAIKVNINLLFRKIIMLKRLPTIQYYTWTILCIRNGSKITWTAMPTRMYQ